MPRFSGMLSGSTKGKIPSSVTKSGDESVLATVRSRLSGGLSVEMYGDPSSPRVRVMLIHADGRKERKYDGPLSGFMGKPPAVPAVEAAPAPPVQKEPVSGQSPVRSPQRKSVRVNAAAGGDWWAEQA